VKPVRKKGILDILTPSNYRMFCKIFEKIVFNQLSTFLNTHIKKLEMFQSVLENILAQRLLLLK